MKRVRTIALGLLLPALSLLVSATHGATLGGPQSRIVNGLHTSDFPTTGALLLGSDPATAGSWCSGTLIGCRTFLTAAHCVCEGTGGQCQGENAPDADDYRVYLQHAGLFAVSSIRVHPTYEFTDVSVADVAIVKLERMVDGVAPTPINRSASPPPGTDGVIVGFGRSGGAQYDYGLKRYGRITTASCRNGLSDAESVCWQFENPVGGAGTDSNTCNGDSGGPLFIDAGGRPVVAGITSGGANGSCLAEDASFDTNVYHFRDWIQATTGPDLFNESCGLAPQVRTSVDTSRASGELSATTSAGTLSIAVPADTRVLRVAMNAEDRGQDFDLYLRRGALPTPSEFDCAGTGSGQFAFCEIEHPAPGLWHALALRRAGSGAYQLTATSLPEGSFGARAVLTSTVPAIPRGGTYSFTLDLRNDGDTPRAVGLGLSLVTPWGAVVPLLAPTPLTLGDHSSVTPFLQLPLPPAAPAGTYGVAGVLVDGDPGASSSRSFLSFEVN